MQIYLQGNYSQDSTELFSIFHMYKDHHGIIIVIVWRIVAPYMWDGFSYVPTTAAPHCAVVYTRNGLLHLITNEKEIKLSKIGKPFSRSSFSCVWWSMGGIQQVNDCPTRAMCRFLEKVSRVGQLAWVVVEQCNIH